MTWSKIRGMRWMSNKVEPENNSKKQALSDFLIPENWGKVVGGPA